MGERLTSSTVTRLQAYVMEAAEKEQARKKEDVVGNELLRRTALVRALDASLYQGPLVQNLPAGIVPSFSEFVNRPELEPLSAESGAYIVRDNLRPKLIEQWRSDPAGLHSFSQSLVNYFQTSSPLDVFTHQIFADPPAALSLFRSLYAAADARFDLAECDTLLRILRNRTDLRGPELTAALNDREQYFRSRSLFADEWLRSAYFLERPGVMQQFQKFLEASPPWLLRVFSAGGGGKTAYLRWLIARYCIPERGPGKTRIPVGRVDMDFVHRPTLAQEPWLLLIPLAEQLNRQLLGAPFQSFLSSWRRYGPLLQPPVSRETVVELPPFDAGRAEQAVRDFTIALEAERVLIVIDTFEEMLIHYSGAVAGLVQHLASVHKVCPGFNVVISGRQDLFAWRDPVTNKSAIPPESSPETDSVVLQMEPWERGECWKYLTVVRKLRPTMDFKDFPELGGGNPFKLSLFADIVGSGNAFSADDIGDLRSVEVEYLILRVIERIPESQCPLRWLLRYAVIPRQLTKGFVQSVLASRLVNAMTSDAMTSSDPVALDAPNDNVPDGAEIVRKRRPWSKCSQTFNAETEWPALLRYAGSANWITLESGQPRLQPEVVTPMRFLLQSQPIVADIHSGAIAYFENLARTPGYDWAEMMCEAVYHKFQLLGGAAEIYWEGLFTKPQAIDPKVRRQLADLLLSGDFLDENHQSLPHPTGRLIETQTVAKALLELAALDARDAIVSNRSELLNSASARLEKIGALEECWDFHIADDGRRDLAKAAIAAQTDPVRALQIIDAALTSPHSLLYDSAFQFLRGNILHKAGRFEEAGEAFKNASASASGSSLIPSWQIQSHLGALAVDRDNLAEAAAEFESALQPANFSDIPDDDLGKLIESLIRVDRSSTNWSQASMRLDRFESVLGRRLPEPFPRLRCELALDTWCPEDILAGKGTSGDSRFIGLALAQVGDFLGASRRLEEYWTQNLSAAPATASQARFEQIQIILRDCQDYRRVRSMLSNIRDLGEFAFLGELLLMELDVATDHRDSAAARWLTFKATLPSAGPRKQARCLATALALELEPRSEFDRLLGLLARVEPAGARIPLLRPFLAFNPKQAVVTAGVSSRFQTVLPAPSSKDPDFVVRSLLLVEVLRYLGDRDSATSMLKESLKRTPPVQIPLYHRLVSALLRMGAFVDHNVLLDYETSIQAIRDQWPELAAIANLQLAEEWLRRDDADKAASLLQRTPQSGTQYAMRFQVAAAKVRERKGDIAEARLFFTRANQMAAELDIPLHYEMQSPSPALVALPADHQLDIYTSQSDLMEIDFRPSGSPPITGTFKLERLPALGSLQESDWKAAYSYLSDRPALSSLLSSFLPLSLGLGESAARVHQNLDRSPDLRLAFGSADYFAALPWEWADLNVFRFVYRGPLGVDSTFAHWQSLVRWFNVHGLVGGLFASPSAEAIASIESWLRQSGQFRDSWDGPETRRAMAESRPPRTVALIKLEQEAERSQSISYGQRGISVEHFYLQAGIQVASFDPRYLGPEGILKIAAEFEILHICLPITEVNGLLQLSVESKEYFGFSPSSFVQMEHRGLAPIVILDVPLPPRRELWAQQLLWRNLFARQLFETSSMEAVVCVGLAEESESYLSTLIQHVAGHAQLGALVRTLNNVPQMSACLYAADPALPF
jgi:tetratricopeptide (TPR) repeat protein